MTSEYKNYGDVNPLDYGGIWVKQTGETEYDIIKYNPDESTFDDLLVDISDSWIEHEHVMNYIGMAEETFDPIQFAIGCTEFYSIENFGHSYIIIDREEMIIILKARGIEV